MATRQATKKNRTVEAPRVLIPRTSGALARMLRSEAGLTRDQVAERAGLSGGTVTNYEQNTHARPDVTMVRAVLDALAPELGLTPQELWADFQQWLLDPHLTADRIAGDLYLAAQVRAVTG